MYSACALRALRVLCCIAGRCPQAMRMPACHGCARNPMRWTRYHLLCVRTCALVCSCVPCVRAFAEANHVYNVIVPACDAPALGDKSFTVGGTVAVGETVAVREGRWLGTSVGTSVGTAVGSVVGSTVGVAEGTNVGKCVGVSVGTNEGSSVVGERVEGMSVGRCVGEGVGSAVGRRVG